MSWQTIVICQGCYDHRRDTDDGLVDRPIHMRGQPCPDCDGTGHFDGAGSYYDHPTGKPCRTCQGRGMVTELCHDCGRDGADIPIRAKVP